MNPKGGYFEFIALIDYCRKMKRCGSFLAEETYPSGIGLRKRKELQHQGNLQEIEEQNESLDKNKDTSDEGGVHIVLIFEKLLYSVQ